MRALLLCAMAAMALSACDQGERTDKAQHADAVRQPPPASEPARNVPGGGSGTAASEEQDSGAGAPRENKAPPQSPPKQ